MSFFFSQQTNKTTKSKNVSADTLHRLQCLACPLNGCGQKNPQMSPSGCDEPTLYFLGEAPGHEEDLEGKPFVGPSGVYLRDKIQGTAAGNLLYSQCRYNNVVRTRPKKNATPTYIEIECCRPSVVADIEKTKPKVIVGLGNIPLRWVIGVSGISIWRGRSIPVRIGKHECWFIPTYHPSYLLRQRNSLNLRGNQTTEEEELFKLDIAKAFHGDFLITPPIIEDLNKLYSGVVLFNGDNETEQFKRLEKNLIDYSGLPRVSIDIETHSDEKIVPRKVRPYGKGARILSCAIGTYKNVSSFVLDHPKAAWSLTFQEKLNDLLYEFLTEAECSKVAHNLSFELEWLAYFYGDRIFDTKWHDSMAQAYVLDGRKGALSLDALVMQQRGFNLKDTYQLDMNNLIRQPLPYLLNYNALDTKYEDLLFSLQLVRLENQGLTKVYTDQVRRIPTLVKTQLKGLKSSNERTLEHENRLNIQMSKIHKQIQELSVVRKYKSQKNKHFNPLSNQQLGDVFSNYLNIMDGYRGKTKQYCVDANVLQEIKHPLAELVLELRKLNKAKTTYVESFRYDAQRYVWPDSKVHPNFKSMYVITRRLSCEEPNVQNFTKRKNRELRSQIIAPVGHWLVACDYGQIEARVIAMASGDARLVSALWDRYDIHQEWGERILASYPRLGDKNDKAFMKSLRDRTKNKFVFPSFYGAQPPSISSSFGLPLNITQSIQNEFWKQFDGVHKWQKELKKQYDEVGYIELLTGFRCRAPLKFNDIINYPIQGTASDIVLNAMNRLSEKATKENRPALQPIMNVHDDLTFYVPEATFDDDIDTIVGEMLKTDFDFVNVPISVEVEMGDDWYNVKPIGTYWSDKW